MTRPPLEQELPRQLAEALSGRVTPKGAALTVRIDSLTIGPDKDSLAWDNISGRRHDRGG